MRYGADIHIVSVKLQNGDTLNISKLEVKQGNCPHYFLGISKLFAYPKTKQHQAGKNEKPIYLYHLCNHFGIVGQSLYPTPRVNWPPFFYLVFINDTVSERLCPDRG
jgi:hypothetical protein